MFLREILFSLVMTYFKVVYINGTIIHIENGTSTKIVCGTDEYLRIFKNVTVCTGTPQSVYRTCEGLQECIVNNSCEHSIHFKFQCTVARWEAIYKSSTSGQGIFNMSDSGIMKPEGIPIRNVQEYTTHSWRNWKRNHVYLVNVTFFRQEKVKQVYVFRKSASKFATFHSDKLLRESRRGLPMQNNTSYRNWCVLSNMLIVAAPSNGQNVIFCVKVIGTSGLSFISQDDLGNVKSNIFPDSVVVSFLTKRNPHSTPTKDPITNLCTRLNPQSEQFYTNVTIWKGLEAKYVCTCDCKDTSATVNKSINESQLRLPCDCLCDVHSVVFPTIGSPDLNKIIFDLKKSLSIHKYSLTAYHRSKTSISDQRPEAVVMGSFAVMILIFCVLLVFLLDIGKWRNEKRGKKRKTKRVNRCDKKF